MSESPSEGVARDRELVRQWSHMHYGRRMVMVTVTMHAARLLGVGKGSGA